jgi:CelD/BcsL family acetyltransferase involved in cellulose biosynthesis
MLLDPAHGGFRALTTPYTSLYEPLIAADGADRAAVWAAFARYCRSFATTRLDALDPATEPEIALAARKAGLVVARFDHFGNWHEELAGRDWVAWLADRPGALRETIRRRTRRAERLSGARFSMFDAGNDLETGIAAFETVYARSWKEPEPFPLFNPAQIRAAASLGLARLGVWWVDDVPAAAQYWIVEHGWAGVLKLAHDEAFKAHSPGTVLTAWMVRHMIEREHVTGLDFGRGDDPYKQGWVANRGQRIGLLLINPRRPAGMLALARHRLGRIKARLRPA